MAQNRWSRLLVLPALLLAAWGRSARAAEFPVVVACPAWQSEVASQVEARIRTTLLAEGLQALRVEISCAPEDQVSVKVVSSALELVRPVKRQSERLEDDVVRAVEAAVRELSPAAVSEPSSANRPAASSASAQPSTPAAAKPIPEPSSSAAPLRAPPPPPSAGRRKVSEIYVAGLSERWSSVWLVGAEAGMSVGDDTLQYGFAGGGLVAAGEPATFELAELSAGARLSMTFAQAAGLRGELGIGFSLLVVTPAADVTPESTTSLRAAFVELQLSRPFWIHSFGIAPGIGGRVFSAARKVRVDGKDRLALPLAAPAVELSLIYRP